LPEFAQGVERTNDRRQRLTEDIGNDERALSAHPSTHATSHHTRPCTDPLACPRREWVLDDKIRAAGPVGPLCAECRKSYPSRGDGQAILAALFANAYQRSTRHEDASAEKATYRRSGRATRRQLYEAVQRYALQDRQPRTEEHRTK
jgi:hypothetical protein